MTLYSLLHAIAMGYVVLRCNYPSGPLGVSGFGILPIDPLARNTEILFLGLQIAQSRYYF